MQDEVTVCRLITQASYKKKFLKNLALLIVLLCAEIQNDTYSDLSRNIFLQNRIFILYTNTT
jgi:hypothetical protein